MQKTNAAATNLQKLTSDALCRLCDELGNQVWTCRRRGWTRKLEQVRSELGRVTAELGRRIKRDEARRNHV
ncbi:MAG: hypothetical protein ACYC26_16650 [Phycisphaerales bacterium]